MTFGKCEEATGFFGSGVVLGGSTENDWAENVKKYKTSLRAQASSQGLSSPFLRAAKMKDVADKVAESFLAWQPQKNTGVLVSPIETLIITIGY